MRPSSLTVMRPSSPTFLLLERGHSPSTAHTSFARIAEGKGSLVQDNKPPELQKIPPLERTDEDLRELHESREGSGRREKRRLLTAENNKDRPRFLELSGTTT